MALEKLRKGKELAEELEMDLAKQRTDWKARMGWVPGLDLKRALTMTVPLPGVGDLLYRSLPKNRPHYIPR